MIKEVTYNAEFITIKGVVSLTYNTEFIMIKGVTHNA